MFSLSIAFFEISALGFTFDAMFITRVSQVYHLLKILLLSLNSDYYYLLLLFEIY
jgi:hypothetical protein